MKTFISIAAILFIVLFFTNFLFAQEKDTLVKKELDGQFSAGSRIDLKGTYFTGGLCWIKKRIQYTVQYSYYGCNYVNLDNVNYSGYLEHAHNFSLLIGKRILIHKWKLFINGGLNYGTGRFLSSESRSYNYGYIIGDVSSYFKTDFIGLLFNCSAKHQISDEINVGLTFSSFFNYYYQYDSYDSYSYYNQYKFKHLTDYYGLQFSMGFKLK